MAKAPVGRPTQSCQITKRNWNEYEYIAKRTV